MVRGWALFSSFLAHHGLPGAHHQGCPYQVLCDSNVLEPWQDSHPHPTTLLPNRRLKSRHSAAPPSDEEEDSALFTDLWEGWASGQFWKNLT